MGPLNVRLSIVGLTLAVLCFAASLTPSLLPRSWVTQGLLSGFTMAAGYLGGVLLGLLWQYLELPTPRDRVQRASSAAALGVATLLLGIALWRAPEWQSSVRALMEMEPAATAFPMRVTALAVVTGALLLGAARLLGLGVSVVTARLRPIIPARLALVLGVALVAASTMLVVNGVLLRWALDAADSTFEQLDALIDDGIAAPTHRAVSGSPSSLVAWDETGRQGQRFLASGPSRQDIEAFLGRPAKQPARVYVGLRSRPTHRTRAELALAELLRVGAFERSVLVVATPTGSGWLDPGATDTLEYLHGGDTAIVSMQYSYLPSWITIWVEPDDPSASARALFDAVYGHWTSLPKTSRPRLYLHGLSLGALGSETSADLFTLFEDPIQGALWSGPPYQSRHWVELTRDRNPDSPAWRPTFRDGAMLRFTGQENVLDDAERPWGLMRFVYLQYASDPMTFFANDLLYQAPDWLQPPRGPDVSPYLRWSPVVMFLQVGFDIPMATTVPTGYGHNYAPATTSRRGSRSRIRPVGRRP